MFFSTQCQNKTKEKRNEKENFIEYPTVFLILCPLIKEEDPERGNF